MNLAFALTLTLHEKKVSVSRKQRPRGFSLFLLFFSSLNCLCLLHPFFSRFSLCQVILPAFLPRQRPFLVSACACRANATAVAVSSCLRLP